MKRLQANPRQDGGRAAGAHVKQLQGEFVESLQHQASRARRRALPTARKQALDELIDERLKLQEAKRLNVVAADDDVDRVISGMAERNKMTAQQFAEHMAKMGANISTMRERITRLAVLGRRHPPQVRPPDHRRRPRRRPHGGHAPKARTTSSCAFTASCSPMPANLDQKRSPSA